MKKYQILLSATLIAAGLFVIFQKEVNALANPSGNIWGFRVNCAAGPSRSKVIAPNNLKYNTLRCVNPDPTRVVFIGGNDVSSSAGYPLGASLGGEIAVSMDTTVPAYCTGMGGSVSIWCLGGQ
jgi:hypothetical protein